MKSILFVTLFLVSVSMAPAKKTKIVFFGDSITQAGVKPGGYIDRIQNWINQHDLKDKFDLIGAGIGGNKVYDLYLRLEDDVLAKDPQIVVIYVGINDVWHKTSMGTGTDLDKYQKFYAALIKKMQAKNIKVFLCTPTVIGEKKDDTNPQDKDLGLYSEAVRKLAADHSCTLIDLRKAFMDYEQANNPDNKEAGILTSDRVHLTDAGNQLVADEMLKKLALQ